MTAPGWTVSTAHRRRALVLAVLLALAAPAVAVAAPGDPDATYAGTGQATYQPTGRSLSVTDVLVQPDGKTLVVGRASFSGTTTDGDILLFRVNPDGTPDASFGLGGSVTIDFTGVLSSSNADDSPTSLALQSTGQVLVAGTSRQDADAATSGEESYGVVARVNADGTPDATFGAASPSDGHAGGRLVLELRNTGGSGGTGALEQAQVADLLVLPDDRILLAGSIRRGSAASEFLAVQLSAQGVRDSSFNGSGVSSVDFGTDRDDTALAVARAGNGDLVLTGESDPTEGSADLAFPVARITAAGRPATSFGTGGQRTLDSVGNGQVTDVVVQADGRLVLAASASSTAANPGRFAQGLVRLRPDGSTDTLGGQAFLPVLVSAAGLSEPEVAIDAAGRLLVSTLLVDGDTRDRTLQLSRFSADGAVDPGFGAGTGAVRAFLGTSGQAGRGFGSPQLALRSDGAAVVATAVAARIDVRRFQGDPAPAPAPSPDRIAPQISALTQSASRWRVGKALPTAARLAPGGRTAKGTRFSITLSEAAGLTYTFESLTKGRKVGKKCGAVKPGKPTQAVRGKACTRVRAVGVLARNAPAGASTLRFEGRITAAKRLRPGRYRMGVRATDAAGNVSAVRTLTFTVLGSRNGG